ELKAQKLIAEIEKLTPAELGILKKAFEEGVEKSRTGLLKYGELSEQIRGVYNAHQVEEIAAHGKSLGLSEKEITDFLEMASIAKPGKKPPKIPLTSEELKQQMENWVNVIKPRGYPYLFESAESFGRFKSELKGVLKKFGVPDGDIVVQGSSLRTAKAKDVDVAIFLSDEEFAKYAQKCRDGLLSRAGEKARDRLVADLDKQIKR